ncbi:MAG TPA: type II TA system antitoxin MqsA family protein [Candidatus Avalokitesvara rifleensis]|uniref:type II TA system antitoxin MqsA family protein n=1 Tax=Candidatus Avalokitesvara rifleensis TaxID=3367620 RepID=UPI00271393B3|nr:DUF4065 domain-containing protein [Candidatus Brocadiales bacterium]
MKKEMEMRKREAMKGVCPNCEKETNFALVHTKEIITVRGESIAVEVEYFGCKACGGEFENTRSNVDSLDAAYREYRRLHGMLQPEEIRELRKSYGLTQGELSKLLGWGGATLSRYENGALQDETHERVLRLIKDDPQNLLRLIQGAPKSLPEGKVIRLTHEIKEVIEEAYSFERIFEERFGNYEPNELSGYKRLDLTKLFAAILFFCREDVYKTKLNKLLFYADFKHYKENTVSITGVRYLRFSYGPVPDKYEYYLALLREEGMLEFEEIPLPKDVIGEEFTSKESPDLSVFLESELEVLLKVKKRFKDFTAGKIVDFSHQEKGYKETPNGGYISYRYSEELQI